MSHDTRLNTEDNVDTLDPTLPWFLGNLYLPHCVGSTTLFIVKMAKTGTS